MMMMTSTEVPEGHKYCLQYPSTNLQTLVGLPKRNFPRFGKPTNNILKQK